MVARPDQDVTTGRRLANAATGPGRRRVGRVVCLVVGVAIGLGFTRAAGFGRVVEVVRGASAWMPALIALEVAVIALDALAARASLRGTSSLPATASSIAYPGRAPAVAWIRATALANACAVFLPAGRAAGEAARASTLGAFFGLSRTVAAFARFQACSLLATATASFMLAALIGTLVSGAGALAPLLLGNGAVCAALGGGIYLLVRSERLSAWVRRVLARLVPAATATVTTRRALLCGTVWSVAGRALQTFQLGLAVLATGGSLTLRSAVTSQGIHLVGASGGDLLPNQVGAMEAAYRYFADPLGFASEPARALSIAVVLHGVQVSLALCGLACAALLPHGAALGKEPDGA